ncbi:MAG: AAA+ family ATPase, partial [Armatimonadota bacterium]
YQWLLVPVQASPQAVVEWQAIRLSGQDPLAVRASKKLRNDELLITSFAGTRLRMELDRVPLWRGDHVEIKQLVEDFARYLYLPRLADPGVLIQAIREGLGLLTWSRETFGYADSYDDTQERYRGLRCGQTVSLAEGSVTGLLVRPERALKQQETEAPHAPVRPGAPPTDDDMPVRPLGPDEAQKATRFHGTVALNPTRVGLDASRIADEVVAHLGGLIGAQVIVTLEIDADVPAGVPDHVVRTVTENARTLKFKSQGFEAE